MASEKKKAAVKVTISQWCLDVLVSAPSQAEIDDLVQYIKAEHDIARLPGVVALAAFALMVRYPGTGARHFGNDELLLLSKRNPAVLAEVLSNAQADADKLQTTLEAALTLTSKPTKKVK